MTDSDLGAIFILVMVVWMCFPIERWVDRIVAAIRGEKEKR